jgi:hypothetical protein
MTDIDNVGEHVRQLRRGDTMPISRAELATALQGWCDDATGMLRRNGFNRPTEPASAIDADEAAVQAGYYGSLRPRAMDLAECGIALDLLPASARHSFQGDVSSTRLYELVDWLYADFIGPWRDRA